MNIKNIVPKKLDYYLYIGIESSEYIAGYNAAITKTVKNIQKIKPVTDEEIEEVWSSGSFYKLAELGNIGEVYFVKFARAILRKAQEK